MTYYVIIRDENMIGVTIDPEALSFGLPGCTTYEFDGDCPDLNNVNWNFVDNVFDKTTSCLSKLDFLSRFTTAERVAIQASVDPILIDAMNLLQMSEFVDVNDIRTMQLVGYLAMTGVIANSRVVEILA